MGIKDCLLLFVNVVAVNENMQTKVHVVVYMYMYVCMFVSYMYIVFSILFIFIFSFLLERLYLALGLLMSTNVHLSRGLCISILPQHLV